MPTYMIAYLKVDNPDRYAQYAADFFPILNKYGGTLLVIDDDAERIEGNFDGGRLVVLSFEDRQRAKRWYESSEYQQIVQHRYAASRANFVVLAETAQEMASWVASEMARPAVRRRRRQRSPQCGS
jgi:uncharacterized protein (DUF1330 family)